MLIHSLELWIVSGVEKVDLNRLRGFYTVVQQGGFTAAARRLRLSQPSISLQVKNLERELGLELLQRHPRGVTPTREGQVLFELAEKLFDTEEEIDAVFSGHAQYEGTSLTVATNQSVATHMLPPLLEKYRGLYPKVEISIHNMRTAEIIESVENARTDVGIILIDPLRDGLEARPVAPCEMILITPIDHPLSHRRKVSLRDVTEYPFLSYTENTDTRRLIDRPFEHKKLKNSVVMELGSTDLIINYVSLGYGISIIHNLNIDAARQDLHIRSLKAYYPRQYIYLVTRRGEELAPPVRGFYDLF